MKKLIFLSLTILLACSPQPKTVISRWVPYDETEELALNADHESQRMRFKLIQSRVLEKNFIWDVIGRQISDFSKEEYLALYPLIFEQDIPSLQLNVKSGALTYEKLTKWYLYRIAMYENDRDKYLNAIISINHDAVKEARHCDKNRSDNDHPLYGMPVLLKDNIGYEGLPTTAGAEVLKKNMTTDAFITQRIKEKGGIILGKTNLSEWANYLCLDCPNGYSAVGGQTLNPYGRKIFDTGGSSSGSGAAMAATFAAAAVGTETSGSILSPSSKSSLVGLKPTVGLLSRSGIVPLSGTLDTPGPMTRSIIDNAILLSAMTGEDETDPATKDNPKNVKYWEDVTSGSLEGLRFGVMKNYLRDSIYRATVEKIAAAGGIMVEFEPEQLQMEGFSALLSGDMKIDLNNYLNSYASDNIKVRTVADIVEYNSQDSTVRIPYGQGRFEGILEVDITADSLILLRKSLKESATAYFEKPFTELQLDAILSVDNRNAGNAAAAMYPCLTVPMGYRPNGEPCNLTFIARPFEEAKLLKMGYAFEKSTQMRVPPLNYR